MKTKVLLISLTFLLLSCSNLTSNNPGQTVVKWVQSLEAGHLDEAVSYWDSGKNIGDLRSNHMAMVSALQKAGGNEYVKVTEEKVTGEVAEVIFISKEKQDGVREGIAKLIKEKGVWKINSISGR